MLETKKRPFTDEQEMGIAKKRAVASITDSPIPVNGKLDSGREELNADNIEVRFQCVVLLHICSYDGFSSAPFQSFRKEAIFRRMKHYSRENERAQDTITELEKRRHALEANVAAIGACWEKVYLCSVCNSCMRADGRQLVQEVRLLVKPETLPAAEELTRGQSPPCTCPKHMIHELMEKIR
jgi:E3 ubiquitin-protein ligase BRE1